VDAVFYWDMTFAEINQAIKSKRKQIEFKESKIKLQAKLAQTNAYNTAELVRIAVGSLFDKNCKFPSFDEFFNPNIEEKPKQQDWRIMKERINAIAAARKRGEKP
jgi:hypothetical protein